MKSLKTLFILTILVAAFLCIGFAAALNQDEASVHAIFSTGADIPAGQSSNVTLLFSNVSNDTLKITYVGIHFDWMPTDTLLGYNLSQTPITVDALGGQVFPPISVSVPLSTSTGTHGYFVEFDGLQGTSQTTFTWDSATGTEDVSGGSSTTSSSPTSTNSSGGSGDSTLILYAAVIVAVVVIVAALIMFMTMRKKRAKPQSTPKQSPSSPETPAPEKKPETGPDFNI